MSLSQIIDLELKQVQTGFNREKQTFTRLILNTFTDSRESKKECLQFEFEYGGHNEFFQLLKEQIAVKQLINTDTSSVKPSGSNFGITGIQRNIQSWFILQPINNYI